MRIVTLISVLARKHINALLKLLNCFVIITNTTSNQNKEGKSDVRLSRGERKLYIWSQCFVTKQLDLYSRDISHLFIDIHCYNAYAKYIQY